VKPRLTAKPKSYYDCVNCPAYCCSVYERVQVTTRDIRRLAKHFGVTEEVATVALHKDVREGKSVAPEEGRCLGRRASSSIPKRVAAAIYHARPAVCREFPITKRCAYYDLLTFEREQQDDPDTLPLVKITFKTERSKNLF
jgi:Fe-S-cluster containining protein